MEGGIPYLVKICHTGGKSTLYLGLMKETLPISISYRHHDPQVCAWTVSVTCLCCTAWGRNDDDTDYRKGLHNGKQDKGWVKATDMTSFPHKQKKKEEKNVSKKIPLGFLKVIEFVDVSW
ncbi:hypothetical protein NPIL_141551 [Nephila pilipes]|uniref:Uncharacterized protein n=1 Tax=Nephila pilipes TaxID=299642 RepID=A0A8X6NVT3_NEPPI|nr:hypothetical protein NPIL_141551 [Nephila pilipes]